MTAIQPDLLGVRVQFNSSHCGLALSAVPIPQHCAVLGLLRQDQIIPISDDPVITVGDVILAIAFHSMLVPALKVALKQSRPVYRLPRDYPLAASDYSNAVHGIAH